jgi:hypothetical protein
VWLNVVLPNGGASYTSPLVNGRVEKRTRGLEAGAEWVQERRRAGGRRSDGGADTLYNDAVPEAGADVGFDTPESPQSASFGRSTTDKLADAHGGD